MQNPSSAMIVRAGIRVGIIGLLRIGSLGKRDNIPRYKAVNTADLGPHDSKAGPLIEEGMVASHWWFAALMTPWLAQGWRPATRPIGRSLPIGRPRARPLGSAFW